MDSFNQREVVESIADFVRRRSPQSGEIALNAESRLLDDGLIDSLGLLELMSFLSDAYKIESSDRDFQAENFETIGSLARLVERKRAA